MQSVGALLDVRSRAWLIGPAAAAAGIADIDTACSRRKRRHRSVAPAADNATLFKLSSHCVARPAEPLPAPRPFGGVLGANSRRRRYRQ